MFSVNNLPTIPQLEESYEERRFNMLIQSGLARGRNEECDSSSEPNQSDMRADPFYPPDLDENGSSVIEAMDISELDDGLIQRSDIPSVVPDILEVCLFVLIYAFVSLWAAIQLMLSFNPTSTVLNPSIQVLTYHCN